MKMKCTATGVVVDANESAAETLAKAGFEPLKGGKKGGKKKDEESAEETPAEPAETEGE